MKRYSLKEDGPAIAFLFGLAAFYFLPVLIQANAQVLSRPGADTWSQFFSWRHFGYSALARGEIPLWNPYVFSGMPYIAGIQSAVFYPLNIPYLLFETPLAINLSIAIHYFLAGLFTYLFARYIEIGRAGSLLSAVTFAYGAPHFFHIYAGHLPHIATMTWLPLMFMGVEAFLRKEDVKYAVLSGIPLCMQVFAGYPQYLFYSTVAVSLYFLFNLTDRHRDLRQTTRLVIGFGIFLATGISLSAIQFLPTVELTQYSVREGLSYEWVSDFSLPPANLITLLLPDFFGDMLGVPYWGKNYLWEMSIYLGIVPLVMAVIALTLDRSKYVVVFSILAAISLVLALGKHTPLLRFLYDTIPGFDRFRGLSKFVFVFSLTGSIIAGYGLKKLTTLAVARDPKLRYLSYALFAASLLFVSLGAAGLSVGQNLWRSVIEGFILGEDRYYPAPPLTDDFFSASFGAAFRDLLKASIVMVSVGGLLLVFSKLKTAPIKLLTVSTLAVAVIDLWSFGSRYLATFDPRDVYMDRELKAFLDSDKEPFRVATPVSNLLNIGLLEGIENVGGYDTIILRNYSEFINFAQGLPIDEPNVVMQIRRISPMLSLLNVKYYILRPAMSIRHPAFDLVFQNNAYRVYRNNDVLPRSFVVHDAWIIKGRDAIFRQMASPGFSPTSHAIIEESVGALPYNPTIQSDVPRVVERSLNKVLIEAQLKESGLLILGDAYYPGWKAFVDGKETKIYRTNYVMRGVFLAKGEHIIEFRYDPLSAKVGALISLTSLVLVAGFLIWFRVKP